MAKSFDDLLAKTSTVNSRIIAAKRTEELLREYKMEKITWLDLYNFLYRKAHDLNNLGSFNWGAEIKVKAVDPKTGEEKEYSIEPMLYTKSNKAELFCDPTLIIKINND